MEKRASRQFNWKEMPMLRLLLPFLAGIPMGVLFPEVPSSIPFWGMGVGAIGSLMLTRRKIPYSLRHVYALCCLLFWLCAGMNLSRQHLAFEWADYFIHQNHPGEEWIGKVIETSDGSFQKAIVEIQEAWCPGEEGRRVKGRALIYPEDPLETGQVILFQAEFQPIPAKRNPMDFDHRRYRFFQNIHHQAYIRNGQYQVIRKEPLHKLAAWRNKQIALWKKLLKDQAVYSVATAMVLGYKEDLPEEVRATYAQTGASHVLAVSGLHVGLIYLLLTGLFRKGNRKIVHIANTMVCLTGIWGFALLTGAAPSVIRAATMFSFILVGKQMRRHISIFNSIAASAFFLLIVNPFWLFHIGFQLSYLAVLGIVIFQPLWYHLWIPPNAILEKIWTLITVSLAAQLSTLPLTLYYFHQFPAYFWLSGLIVVPAAPFIIGLGILMVLFQYIWPAATWIPAFLLNKLIGAVNWILVEIQHLPKSVWQDIYLPGASLLLLFMGILLLAWIWELHRWRNLPTLLLILNAAVIVRFQAEATRYLREKMVVYYASRETLVDYINRGTMITLKSDSLSVGKEEQIAGAFRKQHRVKTHETWYIRETGAHVKLGDFEGHILYPGRPEPVSPTGTGADFTLLCNNPEVSIEEIEVRGILIADASNWRGNIHRWKEISRQKGWTFVDIREKGAIILSARRSFPSKLRFPEKNSGTD